MPRKSVLAILLLTLLVLASCRSQETASQSQAAKQPSQPPVQVKLSEFAFQPNPIRVKAGETVQLELINDGKNEHEFMAGRTVDMHQGEANGYQKDFFDSVKATSDKIKFIKEHGHGSMIRIPAGARTTITFTAPTTVVGEWEVGCFVVGHYQSGMKGALVVEAAG